MDLRIEGLGLHRGGQGARSSVKRKATQQPRGATISCEPDMEKISRPSGKKTNAIDFPEHQRICQFAKKLSDTVNSKLAGVDAGNADARGVEAQPINQLS